MVKTKRFRRSSFLLLASMRFRRSWTSWLKNRAMKKLLKAETRLLLLELERDRQLLLCKELQQRQEQLEHRQQELQDSLQYRLSQHQARV